MSSKYDEDQYIATYDQDEYYDGIGYELDEIPDKHFDDSREKTYLFPEDTREINDDILTADDRELDAIIFLSEIYLEKETLFKKLYDENKYLSNEFYTVVMLGRKSKNESIDDWGYMPLDECDDCEENYVNLDLDINDKNKYKINVLETIKYKNSKIQRIKQEIDDIWYFILNPIPEIYPYYPDFIVERLKVAMYEVKIEKEFIKK